MARNSLVAVSNTIPSSLRRQNLLDTALPALAAPPLAAPHSLPATGFSFLHLSLLPTILPSKLITLFLIPECAQPAFRFNREESHVSIRLDDDVFYLFEQK
jgi:hypothetical protein